MNRYYCSVNRAGGIRLNGLLAWALIILAAANCDAQDQGGAKTAFSEFVAAVQRGDVDAALALDYNVQRRRAGAIESGMFSHEIQAMDENLKAQYKVPFEGDPSIQPTTMVNCEGMPPSTVSTVRLLIPASATYSIPEAVFQERNKTEVRMLVEIHYLQENAPILIEHLEAVQIYDTQGFHPVQPIFLDSASIITRNNPFLSVKDFGEPWNFPIKYDRRDIKVARIVATAKKLGEAWLVDSFRFDRQKDRVNFEYYNSVQYVGTRAKSDEPMPVSSPESTESPGNTKTVDLGGGEVIEFVRIPAGDFEMGSPESEKGRTRDETRHRVSISESFWLGKFEVTQGQWQAVMGSNPSYHKDDPRLPVDCINWNDCQAFIRKANGIISGSFRLPTEEEWEYACRAGADTQFCYGDDDGFEKIGEFAWYKGNSGKRTHLVGQNSPNAWGLYDMHGNVWEWCQDTYGPYPGGKLNLGSDRGKTTEVWKVIRGGAADEPAATCRSAARGSNLPATPYGADRGLRLIWEP